MDADNHSKRAWMCEINAVNILAPSAFRHLGLIDSNCLRTVFSGPTFIRALPVPEIKALSLTELHTSDGRRNM